VPWWLHGRDDDEELVRDVWEAVQDAQKQALAGELGHCFGAQASLREAWHAANDPISVSRTWHVFVESILADLEDAMGVLQETEEKVKTSKEKHVGAKGKWKMPPALEKTIEGPLLRLNSAFENILVAEWVARWEAEANGEEGE